ncbi:MAG: hypothetical protein ACKVS9_01060 [Phycisphaerae bacterium]
MHLVGYDWRPKGVNLVTAEQPNSVRHATDAQGYVWQQGSTHMCECLSTGATTLITPEHALHVIEIMEAARQSQQTGRRSELTTSFQWPVVG